MRILIFEGLLGDVDLSVGCEDDIGGEPSRVFIYVVLDSFSY
jgi:hypothetical protein